MDRLGAGYLYNEQDEYYLLRYFGQALRSRRATDAAGLGIGSHGDDIDDLTNAVPAASSLRVGRP